MYDEHSTYSSLDFLKKLIEYFPFPIREIQTDNGTEWTNALLVKKAEHKTLFEEYLEKNGIIYHRIRVATPRHNGKVSCHDGHYEKMDRKTAGLGYDSRAIVDLLRRQDARLSQPGSFVKGQDERLRRP